MKSRRPLGLYVHIPFCERKCNYCDFYSLEKCQDKFSDYTKLLCSHIAEGRLKNSGYIVDSIYFGGGTPSVIGKDNLNLILSAIYKNFDVEKGCEITLEANPNTVTAGMLKRLRRGGFNRVSFGAQSFIENELEELGRLHSAEQISHAAAAAKKAKLLNFSLDLMYGIPSQTAESWRETLQSAINLSPTHISCYALKLERGTHLYDIAETLEFPDSDLQADMYLEAVQALTEAGYEQYEISNFAKPGYLCRHNYKYWNLSEYWGFGPSAHSFIGSRRFSYVRDLNEYMDGISNGGVIIDNSEEGTAEERASEYLMLMLRTCEGISPYDLEKKHLTYFDEIEKVLMRYRETGHADFDGERWYLTPKGFLVSNTIITDVLMAYEKSPHVVDKLKLYKKIGAVK